MTPKREIAAKFTLLGFVALFVIFFSTPHGQNRAPALGDIAPNFTVQSDNGQPLNLTDFKGQVVVLNFWATWCPPCLDEMPSLNRLAERYAGKGVVVLGVSVDEDDEAYRKFLEQNQISFMTLRNPSRTISEQYGTYKLPESYLISREGRLVKKIIGATNWTAAAMLTCFDGLVAGSPDACQGGSL